MKTVCLIFCLSLAVSVNASENFWCVSAISPLQTKDVVCTVCYNSDVSESKCTGRKVNGCKIVYANGGDSICDCDDGFYLDYVGYPQSTPVDQQCKVTP